MWSVHTQWTLTANACGRGRSWFAINLPWFTSGHEHLRSTAFSTSVSLLQFLVGRTFAAMGIPKSLCALIQSWSSSGQVRDLKRAPSDRERILAPGPVEKDHLVHSINTREKLWVSGRRRFLYIFNILWLIVFRAFIIYSNLISECRKIIIKELFLVTWKMRIIWGLKMGIRIQLIWKRLSIYLAFKLTWIWYFWKL